MKCPRCSAENHESKRFCTTCGIGFGIICARCETINGYEDKYCGSCGFPLSQAQLKDAKPVSVSFRLRHFVARQYSPAEIRELLELRNKMERENTGPRTIGQDDIDKLFEE
jgi:ribosomal protein L37E